VLSGTDGGSGVDVDDLAGDMPVEQHPQRGEVLLDGGGGMTGRQLGQVRRYVIALDRGQAQALGLYPGEDPHGVAVIRRPRVPVGNLVGEEGKELLGGLVAVFGDDGGQGEAAPASG
jgi:hypothetical protein